MKDLIRNEWRKEEKYKGDIERNIEQSKATPQGENGLGWPPKPDNLPNNPQKRLLKTSEKETETPAPKKKY